MVRASSSMPTANRSRENAANNSPLPAANRTNEVPGVGLHQCPVCKRFFNRDRINRHRELCSTKKRAIFDAGFHRVQGTQSEKYYKRKT